MVYWLVQRALPDKFRDLSHPHQIIEHVHHDGFSLGLLFWMFSSNAEPACRHGSVWGIRILRLHYLHLSHLCLLLHAGKVLQIVQRRLLIFPKETAGRSLESMDSLFECPLHHIWRAAYPTQEDFAREADVEINDEIDLDKCVVQEKEAIWSRS
jgi:hypothetical protein